MKRLILIQLIFYSLLGSTFAKIKVYPPTIKKEITFAIIVDKLTYEKTRNSILYYRDAIQTEDNISTYVLVLNDEGPIEIKNEIKKIYTKSKLEGVVFIGDIPIPMIRGAQHMTSAFKMNEKKYPFIRSSVPSDRFYEDFNLQFDFIKRDSINSLLYYYKLTHDSPQRIQKEIYSGRIKAPANDDTKYELISSYLAKVVKAKKNPELLNNAFVFTGHGYNSESLTAWNNETLSLKEQFPQMFELGGRLKHIQHSMSPEIKEILQIELSQEELDMAIFHAHGAEETQYLVGYPPATSISQNVESIKRFLRSKVRYAKRKNKNIEEAKNYYKEKYNLTEEWFEGTFEDSVITADSLYDYKMDIHSDDLANYSPQSEFIVFDECFNGAFHRENTISARYIFDSGNVISSVANSVNVLQDKWANKSIGLFNYGVSIGNWHKEFNYLENHIIGDPTFHFKNTSDLNLNKDIILKENNAEYWEELLNNKIPELRALSVEKLFKIHKEKFIPSLVKIYKEDNSYNVRTHVLSCLAETNSKEFKDILLMSIEDPYEFIRRKSAKLIGELHSNRFINKMIYSMIFDNSKRVSFNLGMSLLFVDQEEMLKEANKIIRELPDFVNKENYLKIFNKISDRSKRWVFERIIPRMNDDTLEVSKRIGAVRMLRNYNFKEVIPELLKVIQNEKTPDELSITIIEAMGWYNYSETKNKIINILSRIITEDKKSEQIIFEAIKTKNRLITGCNVPLTP